MNVFPNINDRTRILDDDDVIHTGASALMFQCTFKVSEFLTIMQSKLEEEHIFGEGIECELLSPGRDWQKGKFRLCLEFLGEGAIDDGGAVPSLPYNPGQPPETLPPPLRRQAGRVGMWS
ncbi:KGK domain-containing protein [Lyngbya sp. CCY1209]|uniref:KGK domain-containing protein n=1 Tax=Lyngbya sp. CCY1209 TaxID=2886103 RepID=UPI002D212692|nr:KGK domain-containing protein [Lyngbya sp. CCY1209]MEB3885109.1 KGK family protein [Lyngbya sp. CCY1209]